MEENRKRKRINWPELSGKESFQPLQKLAGEPADLKPPQKKQQQATTSPYILNKEERFGNVSK